MRSHAFLLGVAVLGVLSSGASDARAQGAFGFGNLTGLPYNYFQSQQELPYFAKFPPVYYSYPVARTYGYSPFAYPPGIMTPEIPVAAAPIEIENPYFPGELPAPSSGKATSAESLTGRRSAGSRRASLAAAHPKVIMNPHVLDSVASDLANDRLSKDRP